MPGQIKQGRFTVHIYKGTGNHTEHFFENQSEAFALARTAFTKSNCYKVKVWDKKNGPIEPNTVNPPGLVLHLF